MGMEHPRTLIREAAIAQLVNARTSAGPRVFDTRFDPYKSSLCPVISVFTLSEQVDPDSVATAPRELKRLPKLEVVAWVRDTTALPIGRAMDQIAREIERAMKAADPFAGLASRIILESTEMEVQRDGDPQLGVIALTFAVTYYDDIDVAEALATDEYLRTGTTTDIDGAGSAPTVSDLFNQRPAP